MLCQLVPCGLTDRLNPDLPPCVYTVAGRRMVRKRIAHGQCLRLETHGQFEYGRFDASPLCLHACRWERVARTPSLGCLRGVQVFSFSLICVQSRFLDNTFFACQFFLTICRSFLEFNYFPLTRLPISIISSTWVLFFHIVKIQNWFNHNLFTYFKSCLQSKLISIFKHYIRSKLCYTLIFFCLFFWVPM